MCSKCCRCCGCCPCSPCCRDKKNKHKKGEAEDVGFRRKKKQWHTFSVACCENWGNCWCCIVCFPCAMADLYHYIFHMPWGMALLLSILLLPLHPFVMIPMRLRVRSKHKLEGNICNDLLCILLCCWPSHICQVRDQIHYLKRREEWQLSYADNEEDVRPPWLRMNEVCRNMCKKKKKNDDDDDDDDDESDLENGEQMEGDDRKETDGEEEDTKDDDDEEEDTNSESKSPNGDSAET